MGFGRPASRGCRALPFADEDNHGPHPTSPVVRRLLRATAVLVSVTVAAILVVLGMHWLTDVAARVVIGYAWFVICGVLFAVWLTPACTPPSALGTPTAPTRP